MSHQNLHSKLSILSSLLEFGTRLKVNRATGGTHKKYEHFSSSKNSTFNADEVIESSFAEPDDSES